MNSTLTATGCPLLQGAFLLRPQDTTRSPQCSRTTCVKVVSVPAIVRVFPHAVSFSMNPNPGKGRERTQERETEPPNTVASNNRACHSVQANVIITSFSQANVIITSFSFYFFPQWRRETKKGDRKRMHGNEATLSKHLNHVHGNTDTEQLARGPPVHC